MLRHNVHPSVSLDYTFPQPSTEQAPNLALTADVLLSKNLRVQDDPLPQPARVLEQPISKNFPNGHTEAREPLQELLEENRAIIGDYKLELPFSQDKPTKPKTMVPVSAKNASPRRHSHDSPNKSRGIKRFRQHDEEEAEFADITECSYIQAETSSIYNTPIPNKTIYFSPSGSSKKPANNLLQSTPVSFLKEAQLNHQKSNKKLLTKKSSMMLIARLKEETKKNTEADESDYDHLACHADNIMRMAVDSTMLGSSFSSSFSNTFGNDSVLGLQSKKKYPDFFNDENDSDRSILEGMKARWTSSLAKLKATKTTIDADDLQAAVAE
ncbi:uncharacterized protein CANTADRAFT_6851 [Suhomyces tanzawaensis NRRL Y-17324]|uniref:Uncharacterized protein n=1 Tax=Suhomyces tanzawaensis NRRL Y-17324 TaxID=984487 RepID=A0A1E4SGC2_9ASCO|nr:uncharacterized protein CANTADRAFT_6851 [Suhomyces tanzawaensis NRRL Y-17324]ODV78462.1 hypothetical protein CANTADRAFT_6851 [Suhomyces tanzawaensis NRRL Y-17324]